MGVVSFHADFVSVMMMVMTVAMAAYERTEFIVTSESPFCTPFPGFLTCDFKEADKTAILEEVNQVNKIFVHNVQELVVVSNGCVNLAIYNVARVTFNSTIHCLQQDLSLKLVNSGTNLVPGYISHLDLAGSSAQKVVCHNKLKFLNIINSNVGVLDILQPLHKVTVKLEDSKIDTLTSLKLDSKSQLLMRNVTINTLGKNSIHVLEASANIWISNIKSSLDQAITLGPKSTLSIKDVYGKVTFAGLKDINGKVTATESQNANINEVSNGLQDVSKISGSTVPKVMSRHREALPQLSSNEHLPSFHCSHLSHFTWILPTLLAIAEALIIIFNCTNWFPALKSRYYRQGVEEGIRGKGISRERGVNYSDSTCYFNRETTAPFYTNTRQRMNDKDA
nr:uncharacterized protein LOC128695357 [Cherax quadricarinatus]